MVYPHHHTERIEVKVWKNEKNHSTRRHIEL